MPHARSGSGIVLFFLATMLVVFPPVVEASVVDSGSTYNYNGTDWPIAYDQTNNLYWLNLGATEGLSVDQTMLSGLLPDWQFSTLQQGIDFFDSVETSFGTSPSAGVHDGLVTLWGFWPGTTLESTSRFLGYVANNSTNPTDAGWAGIDVTAIPPVIGVEWNSPPAWSDDAWSTSKYWYS